LKPTQQTGDVWHSKRNGPLTASGIYQVFSRIAKRAEISDKTFNPHAWRHAFGRDMTASGMPTKTLQQILGHEYIETTGQYSEVELETMEDAYHKFVFDDEA
jgi:site-specific recombinase XerD